MEKLEVNILEEGTDELITTLEFSEVEVGILMKYAITKLIEEYVVKMKESEVKQEDACSWGCPNKE
jgi:hypothetical protein